jgi:hypothetical protein
MTPIPDAAIVAAMDAYHQWEGTWRSYPDRANRCARMTRAIAAALRPPEKWERLRWHWIDTPTGKEPWMWICDGWLPAGYRMPSDMTAYVGCKYSHPCDPTAIVPDPNDPGQLETVARAICAANRRDPDAPRWADAHGQPMGICWHENIDAARAVLTALKGDGT